MCTVRALRCHNPTILTLGLSVVVVMGVVGVVAVVRASAVLGGVSGVGLCTGNSALVLLWELRGLLVRAGEELLEVAVPEMDNTSVRKVRAQPRAQCTHSRAQSASSNSRA